MSSSGFYVQTVPSNYDFPRRGEKSKYDDDFKEVEVDTVEELNKLLEKYPLSVWQSRDGTQSGVGKHKDAGMLSIPKDPETGK